MVENFSLHDSMSAVEVGLQISKPSACPVSKPLQLNLSPRLGYSLAPHVYIALDHGSST